MNGETHKKRLSFIKDTPEVHCYPTQPKSERKYDNAEIILCILCKGTGQLYRPYNSRYGDSEYHEGKNTCDLCKGSGRLIRLTLSDLVPYTDNSDPNMRMGSTDTDTRGLYI